MRRLLPSPVLSAALFVLWLLLRQSLSADTLLWGAVLSVGSVALTASLRPGRVRLKAPLTALRLLAAVFADMVVANVAVVRLILSKEPASAASGFVRVPLDLHDPGALAVLAVIICFTPGTTWAELSYDRKVLLIHVLATHRPEAVIAELKERYERPLKEIFE
jgi:multicomponent K+:H+ antiporter subunit E